MKQPLCIRSESIEVIGLLSRAESNLRSAAIIIASNDPTNLAPEIHKMEATVSAIRRGIESVLSGWS